MRANRGSSGPVIRDTQRRTSPASIGAPAASMASMSTQSFGRSKTALQTTRWSAASTGIVVSANGHRPGGVAGRVVERVVAEEQVDRVAVPPQPDLPVALERVGGRVAGDAERPELLDHAGRVGHRHEHVEVDVDRGPGLGVVRQRERATERVRDLGERAIDRDDLLGERRRGHADRSRGNASAPARAGAGSRPRGAGRRRAARRARRRRPAAGRSVVAPDADARARARRPRRAPAGAASRCSGPGGRARTRRSPAGWCRRGAPARPG